ncbi:hypothetical protein WG66_016368 [Moniliophthora roreri]|nr:hypothetical protein WG66_016368 [Moniliophthora roreri]
MCSSNGTENLSLSMATRFHLGYDFTSEFNIAGNDEDYDLQRYSFLNSLPPLPQLSALANKTTFPSKSEYVKLPQALASMDFSYSFVAGRVTQNSLLYRLLEPGKHRSEVRWVPCDLMIDPSPVQKHLGMVGVCYKDSAYEQHIQRLIARTQQRLDIIKQDRYVLQKVLYQLRMNEGVLEDNIAQLDAMGQNSVVPCLGLLKRTSSVMNMDFDGGLISEVTFVMISGNTSHQTGRRRAQSLHASAYYPSHPMVTLELPITKPLEPYTIHGYNADLLRNEAMNHLRCSSRNAGIMEQILYNLDGHRRHLEEYIVAHQSLLSKFNILPAELLSTILSYANDPQQAFVSRAHSLPNVLMNVSGHWRAFVTQMPHLWTSAVLESGIKHTRFTSGQLARLTDWYGRSGNMLPLSLGVSVAATPSHYCEPELDHLSPYDISTAVRPYGDRIETLYLHGADAAMVEGVLSAFRGSRLILRNLVYCFAIRGNQSITHTFNNITNLTLEGNKWSVYSYSVTSIDPSTILHILEHCPKLLRLELPHLPIKGRTGRGQQRIRVEALTHLTLNLNSAPLLLYWLVMPRLRSLEVSQTQKTFSRISSGQGFQVLLDVNVQFAPLGLSDICTLKRLLRSNLPSAADALLSLKKVSIVIGML